MVTVAKHYLNLGKILQKLLYDKRINVSALAREVELPVPTVHRLVTGKSTRPYRSSLQPIADYFGIEVDQLLGEKPLPLSEETGVEVLHPSLSEMHVSYVSFVPWEKLHSRDEVNQKEKIPYIGQVSSEAFATTMPDTSMEPFIQRESILIFDPATEPVDRSCILVKLQETGSYTLRQILIDASNKYLKPLNPDLSSFKMRLLDDQDKIVACLVEARNKFYAKDIDPKYKELDL